MASDDVVFIGWNRAIVGREAQANELFMQSLSFYEAQQKAGNITSFELYILDPHFGAMNGFAVLHGTRAKLDALVASDAFTEIATRGVQYLDQLGVIRGVKGEAVGERIAKFMSGLPKE